MPNVKYQKRLAQQNERNVAKFERDGQAPISGEFWIVRRINLPAAQFLHFFGVSFRHATVESAQSEADRLTMFRPGELFGIFYFTGLVGMDGTQSADLFEVA